MSGTTVKGIKRSSSLSSSRRIATSAAKSRTTAGKSSRPKPLVKKKAEKAPAIKATKGKVTASANKSKKTTAKSSAARTKASSKAEKPLKSSAPKAVSPTKAAKKSTKKTAAKKAVVKKEVKKKVVTKPKVSTKTSKKAVVKTVKKPAKAAAKPGKKAAVVDVKKKSPSKTVAKVSRPVKKAKPKKAAKKIILPPPRKILPPPTPRQPSLNEAAALKVFEKAHKEFVRGRFTEARNQFRAFLEKHSGVVEVAARARTYLAIAESRMKTETSLPKDADSLYDRGVIELNRGEYAAAQDFFERALKHEPNAAHIFYGIAATKAQLGETEEALKFLEQSFALDPVLRFRSVQDPDLTPLHSVPEFEQLVAS